MSTDHDSEIRRRPDGSIDIEFYAGRAMHLHHAAIRQAPARWVAVLFRLVGRPARQPGWRGFSRPPAAG